MNIAIDLDDVLAETMPAIVQFHNERHGTHFSAADVKTFDVWETFGCSRQEAIDEIYEFHRTRRDEDLPVIAGARDACAKLAKEHKLFVLTSRRIEFTEQTNAWIEKHFPGIFSGVSFTNYYSADRKKITKGDVCNEIRADVFIEDNPAFAAEAVAPVRQVLLFENFWNRNAPLPDGIVRVKSWKEILERLK
ncbi:MAG: hypothetical protein KGH93_01225 [Patescibacteria group bacterium]|nr:hypothetical protein [Patescibacteria group bacterium]MDE1945803.1 hypothetical protein [Patescibacteria group bacterium]